jgi:3-oxoacyl-ACP reductase-like protein
VPISGLIDKEQPMIVVTAPKGHIGHQVVEKLLEQGAPSA